MSQENDNKQVVDLDEIRSKRMDDKRRKTERIFFKHLLNVYSVVDANSVHSIEMIDMSEDGCSFQVPFSAENPWPTDLSDLPLRFYFTQDTYLEIYAKIQNSRPSIENNRRYIRFGCSIDQSTRAYPAYLQFVRFLKLYAEQSHRDNGAITTFFYL